MRINLKALLTIIISQLTMTTYEILIEKYNKIIAGQSTESIKEAENELIRLEPDPLFVDINVAIICETGNQVALRKFAAVYLNKYSKKIIKQRGLQKCMNTLQQYLKILKCAHLEIEIKSLIVAPIQVIITSDLGRSLKQQFATEYIRLINEAINQNDADIDFTFIVFCGQSLFIRDAFNQQTKEIIKSSMQALIKLMIRLIVRASGENILQNREKSLHLLRIIKQFALLLRQYFKRLALLDIQCTKILYLQEIASLITLALNLNYKQNEIESSLYVSIPGEELISKIINIIKANFFVVMTNFVRLSHTFTKNVNLYATNRLFLKIPEILTYSIKSTSSLLQRVPFYQLPHKIMIMETLDEVLNFYISCLRVVSFYQTFCDNKLELIEKIILPCLSLTPQDIDNFYEDSQEFIQNTLQIVGRDLRIPDGSIQSEDPEDEIKQFETLRTLSAEFLSSFCKFQDGTLTHVIEYAISILNGSQGSKSLMFLIICILSIHFKDRKDLRIKITNTLYELLKNTSIPIMNGNKKQEDIQYAYLLLTLSKTFFFAMDQKPDIISLSYKVGISIIQSPSVNQVHKYFVFEIFNNLARVEEASQYIQDLMTIYNHLLKTMPQPSIYLLDSYFTLIKFNTEQLKVIPACLLETLKYVCLHIQKQVEKPQPFKMLLCKYWNIIRQVGQCDDFIPHLIQPIEELIVPLLPYIDGKRDLDYEEDILMLLTSFIQKSKRVTVNQQKMFEIIPRIFYNQYNYRFGHSFHAIQLFIYYGKDILCQNYAAIQSIIDMSLVSITTLQHNKKPINETQNCQGALVLQSLILKCGEVFNVNSWQKIIKVVKNRLSNRAQIRFRHLTSNLYALLSLCLIHSFKFFPNQDNEMLLSTILSQLRVYNKIQYSPKVVIAGLTELLLLSQCEFVGRRFTQILDTVITMLEVTAAKKEELFDDEEADEEKQYANALIMLKNDLKGLDEFTFFRQQVEKLKIKNLPLLQKSVAELPKSKKDFFMHILRIERVANEPRQIYKIKR